MSFMQDLIPIFKQHNLVLVEKKQEVNDIFTFIFEPKDKIYFKSGQHGIFFIRDVKIKKASRAFSIASTPDEGNIMISMRISERPSEFKQVLSDMKPGESIIMRGPIGSFYFTSKRPVLLIAGGIGITPYRALIKDSIKNQDGVHRSIKLLYADTNGDFVYKEELDEMHQDNFVEVEYIDKREQLMDEIKGYASKHKDDALYFISGTPSMVKSIKETLRKMNIQNKNIKADVFIGY